MISPKDARQNLVPNGDENKDNPPVAGASSGSLHADPKLRGFLVYKMIGAKEKTAPQPNSGEMWKLLRLHTRAAWRQ
jgi:hypothetical protein